MERVGLDHHTLEIQLAKQRFKHSPFMVLSRGVVGLADGYRQCRRVEGDMRNERRTTAGGGLDRTAHGFAVADKLIQFLCATRDLGERPITDGRTEHRNVYLMEEVSEGRIRWRAPQLDSQCAGESDVVADGEPLEITKSLAAAKDAENSDQEEVPGRNADPTSPSDVRDGAQEADQVKIGCGSWGFRQGDTTIPPRTPQAKHLGLTACDRLLISPGDCPIRVIMSSDADQALGAQAFPYNRRALQ